MLINVTVELVRTCNDPLYIVQFDQSFDVFVDASSYAVAVPAYHFHSLGPQHRVRVS